MEENGKQAAEGYRVLKNGNIQDETTP